MLTGKSLNHHFADEKGVAIGWISFCKFSVYMARCRDVQFLFACHMNGFFYQLQHMSNDMDNFKSIFLKKVIAINIIVTKTLK